MKILMVHNYYLDQGGEKISFELETQLLESKGHQVIKYTRDNWEIAEYGKRDFPKLALNTIWSKKTYQDIKKLIEEEKPDISHFQNTFPLISPSGYYACQEERIPVVQSIRNYRLICPSAIFQRDGHICELCLGKLFPWPGIYHACYRDSRIQSSVVASMLTYHRLRSTWENKVDVYIALTDFVRKKMIEGGLPTKKIQVKPNFIHAGKTGTERQNNCIFIGRLSSEKGINLLLYAWRRFPDLQLKVVGDGPLKNETKAYINRHNLQNIELLGKLELKKVQELLSSSRFLIFPTQWFEPFGRVIIEAYSCGVPVVASRIGAVEELVIDGETGLLFDPHNVKDLISRINWMYNHPQDVKRMGKNARREYEQKYTPEKNYRQLMNIYENALNRT